MLRTDLSQFTAADFANGVKSGLVKRNDGYHAGWIAPEGAIVSVTWHQEAFNDGVGYPDFYEAGYVRLTVEPNLLGFTHGTVPLTRAQADACIRLAVGLGLFNACFYNQTTWKDTASVRGQRELVDQVRSMQATVAV